MTSLGSNVIGLRKILVTANTAPPSRKSLQKTSNIVMAKAEKLNEADMSRRSHKSSTWKLSPHAIPVQCVGMYNNPLYSGIGKTQFQPAT